jgi:hypothetical protein
MTTNKTTMGLLRMKYLKTGQAFMIACCLAAMGMMQSCTKECPTDKEGENCELDIVDKFTGTWSGQNDCNGTGQLSISRTSSTTLTITGLFNNQVYPLIGTVNYSSVEFESGQTLADGVTLQDASGHISADDELKIYFSYQDQSVTPAQSFDCRFSGTLLTPNSTEGLPQIITLSVFTESDTTARSGGNIISQGASAVTKRGICWGTSPSPTVNSPNKTEDGNGAGTFVSYLFGLEEGTTYYLRAYAVNSVGTAYGNEEIFTKAECIDDLCIGQSYLGGTIAYFFQPGDAGYVANEAHGLIVSNDLSNAPWGCNAVSVGTSVDYGTGESNTDAIINNSCSESETTAADVARSLGPEWYLPSRGEFQSIYENLGANGIGGISSDRYWTSSEDSGLNAWTFDNQTGQSGVLSKYNDARVKAVKEF